MQLTLVSPNYNFLNEVLNNKYNGIFISNGPGDPRNSENIIEQLSVIFQVEYTNTYFWNMLWSSINFFSRGI